MPGPFNTKRPPANSVTRLLPIILAAAPLLVHAQALPFEPQHEAGASVTGAFEGWFKNPDGTFSLLLGYFNRNSKQELDIPIGPNNRIEPGGPDRGQPTHFLPGRLWGLFAIKVPADFGTQKITWTLTANGQTTVIPASLNTDYEISPLVEAAIGNTPPMLSFEENAPRTQGPQGMIISRTAKAGVPMELKLWALDDAKLTTSSGARPRNLGAPVTLHWFKYRGPGEVKFSKDRPAVEGSGGTSGPFSGTASTSVTFSEPGDYMLHVVANDYSGDGGGGFQCCWTNAQVKVTVQP
jgi:hypothetical protein